MLASSKNNARATGLGLRGIAGNPQGSLLGYKKNKPITKPSPTISTPIPQKIDNFLLSGVCPFPLLSLLPFLLIPASGKSNFPD
jgi:hypothetical protein